MKDKSDEVWASLQSNKNTGFSLGSDPAFEYQRIAFGIPVLDSLTGGGIPKKRLTLIYGPTNVGKSYLATQIAVNAQKNGERVGWIDTELSWDPKWQAKCGLDLKNALVRQPDTGEEAFEILREMLNTAKAAKIGAIVLDSVAGLVPTQVMDEEFGFNPVAWQGRFVNNSLPRLIPSLKNSGCALIMINQVRSSLAPTALDAMPGGLAQTFFSHSLIQVRRKGWIEENRQRVGFDMEVRLRKSKIGGEHWGSAVVPFRIDGGIDILESFIRDGIESNIITRTGAWYTFGDTKAMGMNGIKMAFNEDPSLLPKLQKALV